jgi:hypothetical protein
MANKDHDQLKAVLQALAEERQTHPQAHATVEELMAYHTGDMSVEEKDRWREHLVWCRECLDLLFDIAAWVESGQEDASPGSDEAMGAAWQALWARLQRSSVEVTTAGQPREAHRLDTEKTSLPPVGWRQRLGGLLTPARLPYAIAASLLMISLGLGAWNWLLRRDYRQQAARFYEQLAERDHAATALTNALTQARQQQEDAARRSAQSEQEIAQLRRTVAELSQPQINIPISDLQPRELLRGQRAASAVQMIAVPSGSNFFTLVLNTLDQPSYADYELEISDQRGNSLWHQSGLRENAFNNFTVMLPRQLFPAGPYRIRLYGLRASRRHLVEEYTVRIQYQ